MARQDKAATLEWENDDPTRLEEVELMEETPFDEPGERTPPVSNDYRDLEGNLRLPPLALSRFRELAARMELASLKQTHASDRWLAFLDTNVDVKRLKSELTATKAAFDKVQREVEDFRNLVSKATGIKDFTKCTVDDETGRITILGEDE